VFSPSGDYKSFVRIACGQPVELLRSAIRVIAASLARSSAN
jgi:hypothetical protein